MPAYADGDSIVIADSESNIVRALGYGVLNDRVTSIDITESSTDSDGKLTVTASQAQKLGDYGINVTSSGTTSATTIVVKDRSSAIAEFIESGNIPSGATIEFEETSGRVIDLDYSETQALLDLIQDGSASVSDITYSSSTSSFSIGTSVFTLDQTSLEARFASLESQVSVIDSEVGTLQSTVDSVETKVDTIDTNVDNLTTAVSTIDSEVGVIDSEVEPFSPRLIPWKRRWTRSIRTWTT